MWALCFFAALVNNKETGEPDLQDNTNPSGQGIEKKAKGAKKRERAKKRAAPVLDSSNGETCPS
jgi:hypothetical protein